MKKLIYGIKRAILTVFGDIKVFKWPMFVLYNPKGYLIKGDDTRDVMSLLVPGDVVMRAYNNYLDGYFIPKGTSGCSHSGVYVGDNKIVHSIAEGSTVDDIIEFCRADRIVVLRPRSGAQLAVEHAVSTAKNGVPYDFNFENDAGKYYCHEFTASCFPDLHIEVLSRKTLGFLPSPKAYLADSFYTNERFTKLYEK